MSPPKPLTRAQLLAGFTAPIPPVKQSFFYRLGLFLVCLMMVLLPLAYVGLIGLVGWGVTYHATHNITIFEGRGRGFGKVILYLTPIITGAILILFMIKPLFARREKPPVPLSLNPAGEPLLFDLIRKLCETVGAPMPRRIDVDGQANASASFRRGFLSFFGHDLLLTIGLPLAAGLSLRNLVGVLAHEFGHFAQGSGMRATYLIRAVNAWFARVVYERDAWDAHLEAWSKEADWRIAIVLHVTRFFVWLSRRVLWVLMHLGHAVSMFMLRQMEYDADQYEVEVAGSRSFTETARSLPLLNLAHQVAIRTLQESWNERRLGDNLPRLIMSEHARIPPEVRQEFLKEQLQGKGSVFDTHPPDQKRIEAAIKANAPGIFTLEAPGSAIFVDFDALSRRVTYAFYRSVLGDEVTEKNLIRTEELVEREKAQTSDQESMDRYFQGLIHAASLPFLPDEAARPAEDAAAAAAELKAAREEAARLAPEAAPAIKTLKAADERLSTLNRLDLILRANLRFKPADFDLKSADAASVSSARRPMQYQKDDSLKRLRPVQEAIVRRLTLALRISHAPEMIERLADTDLSPAEVDRLLAAHAALREAFPDFTKLVESFDAADLLLNNIQGNEENEALVGQIRAAAMRWEKMLARLGPALSRAPYPFDHAQGDLTLAQFIVGPVPSAEDIGATIGAVQEAAGKFYNAYARILGRLVHLAEKVEAALGPPPPSPGNNA